MPTLPKTFKALQAPDIKQDLVLNEIELKTPEAGEILVKIEACGVCYSDHGVLQGEFGPL